MKRRRPPEYTMKELKAAHDQWIGEGHHVGLMDHGTPEPVQNYVYRNMRGKWKFLNVFDDIRILLKRNNRFFLLRIYMPLYNTLYRFQRYVSTAPQRKEKEKQERIRKEMLENGNYVGSGDYYEKEQR